MSQENDNREWRRMMEKKNCNSDCVIYKDCNMAQFGGICSHYRETPKNETEEHLAHAMAGANDKILGIKDSGDRTEFTSGAVRDLGKGKGNMISIPAESLLRLSKHYENGAEKYGMFNFRKGIPLSSFIDSAMRHLLKYEAGEDDEDHLSAIAFNILGAMLMESNNPDMMDLPMREGKETFNYFER